MEVNSEKIRCAIVGVGYLGNFHAQKYNYIDSGQLIGICDLDSVKGEKVAKDLKTSYFKNPNDLIGKIDAVIIATTTDNHYSLAKTFLDSNVHVFIEKPITVSSKDAEDLIKLANYKKLKLQVGHIERFNPAFLRILPEIKNPKYIECRRLTPFRNRGIDVSVVHDLMIHDLDLVLSFVKSPIKKIKSFGQKIITDNFDFVNCCIEFDSSIIANFTASRVEKNVERSIKIFQENNHDRINNNDISNNDISNNDIGNSILWGNLATGEFYIGEKENGQMKYFSGKEERKDLLLEENISFINSIKNNTSCLVSGEEGMRALRLVEQILDVINSKNI